MAQIMAYQGPWWQSGTSVISASPEGLGSAHRKKTPRWIQQLPNTIPHPVAVQHVPSCSVGVCGEEVRILGQAATWIEEVEAPWDYPEDYHESLLRKEVFDHAQDLPMGWSLPISLGLSQHDKLALMAGLKPHWHLLEGLPPDIQEHLVQHRLKVYRTPQLVLLLGCSWHGAPEIEGFSYTP